MKKNFTGFRQGLALILSAFIASGCVAFQNMPDVPTGCDERLAGKWQKTDSPPDELAFEVNRQCQYYDLSKKRKTAQLSPVHFRTLTVSNTSYAAFTPEAVDILIDEPYATHKTFNQHEVFLVRYSLANDDTLLQINVVDPDYAEQAIRDGSLNGELHGQGLAELKGSSSEITKILKTQPALFGSVTTQPYNPDSTKTTLIFQKVGTNTQTRPTP